MTTQKTLLCKKPTCRKEFIPPKRNPLQSYCSRDCAPYGNWKDTVQRDRFKKKSIYAPRDSNDEDYNM